MAASPLYMILGPFAVLAVLAGVVFLLVAVASLVVGDRVTGSADNADLVPDGGAGASEKPVHAFEMRGTFLVCLVFMAVFVVSYVLNWYLLTQLWHVGA
jgi:cytochrome c oxidase subunit 1